ncbi:MAG: hypothetical protein HYY13_13180 [Nitrospirae bacterium]|nr:hypothetical protein [Nitrospirota bacterium]
MIRRLATTVNLVFLTLIGYVNAHLITNVIDGVMVSASRPAPLPVVSATAPAETQAKDYSAMLDRNIFDAAVDQADVDAASQQDIDAQKALDTALNLCLVGTVVSSDPAHSFAAIQDLDMANKDVSLHFVGTLIKSDVRLVRVDRTVVFFERLGYLEKLELCEDGKRKVSETPSVAAAPAPKPQTETPETKPPIEVAGGFVLERATVDEHLSNLSALLTQARVVPHFNRGVPDGFRIFSIRPGSLFEQIGLKNGDVLHSINGLDITTTEEALKAFTQLKGANRMTLQLERNGTPQAMNYDIR